MKKLAIALLVVLLLSAAVFALPVSAAENEQMAKGIQVAADAAQMTFPTDGTEGKGICPVCQIMTNWIPLGQENFATAGYRLENGKHYYLAESIEGDNARIGTPESSGEVGCIHLNGKGITATHATSAALTGNGGTLNVMGSGLVKGSITKSNYGSAVQINTAGSKGTVNLYGGTYSKVNTSANTNVIGIRPNGGIINLYAGAKVEGGTNGSAIYLSTTSKVKGTVNIYGATVDNRNSSKVAVKISATDSKAVQVHLYSGEILGGAAGAVSVDSGSAFRLYGGAVTGNGTADAVQVLTGGVMQLGGSSVVKQGSVNVTGTLHVGSGWAGSAAVRFATEYAVGESIPTTLIVADGSFTGRLLQAGTVNVGLQPKADGSFYVAGTQLVKADGTALETTDPLTDWAAGEYAYMKLNGDLRIADLGGLEITTDLNGFQLSVGGSGKLQLLDSANDTYDAAMCGKLVNDGTVTVAEDVLLPDGRRYIALTDGNVTTAHRLEMALTTVTLRTEAAGLYYKAQYDCDEMLAALVKQYGVALSLANMPGVDFMTEGENNCYTAAAEPFTGGVVATSGSVFGIMKDAYTAAYNAARGEMRIYANPYICLQLAEEQIFVGDTKNPGKTVTSEGFDGVACNLRSVMDTIQTDYFTYTAQQRDRLDEFYAQWKDKGMDWQLTNLEQKVRINNENLSFAEGNQEAWCDVCKKQVLWTPVTQQANGETPVGSLTAGSHHYLAEDITYTGTGNFLRAPGSGSACLHLNGHDLTSTSNRAIMGYSGVLNVLGNGNVAGYNPTANRGAAVDINTNNKNGTVNLYGGTYSEYENTDAMTVSIYNNGGRVNVYEGAKVAGAVYVGSANLTDAVLGIYGGAVTGKTTLTEAIGEHISRVETTGQAQMGNVLVPMSVDVSLSGAPVIKLLELDFGAKIRVNSLAKGTDVKIRGAGPFAEVGDRAEEYAAYFHAYFETDSIVAENGTLVNAVDYTTYLSPWENDVIAQAKEDGKIHYYFMASEKLWLRKSHNNEKWGDSCLIVFPDGQTMLVDSGYQDMGPLIWRNLQRMGVTKLDHLVISHPHVDHYGGAFGYSPDGVQFAETGFLDQIAVEQVYINGVNMENDYAHELILYSCEKHEIPVTTLKPGDLLHIGDVKLEVLWPNMDVVDSAMTDLTKDVNDTSIVFRLDYKEHSALFTGDLYVRGEGWLLDSIDDVTKLDVDFLKIPHHGRNTSSSAAFVNAVTPELAVFTGRAAQGQVDEVYAAANAILLNDEDHGYIHVTADQDGIMTYETTR